MPSIQVLVGEIVSHVWFSDYSICYLEFGALKAGARLPNGRLGNPSGEFTLFLGYDWVSEVCGLHRTRLELHANALTRDSLAAMLQGTVVRSVNLVAGSSEIELCFSTDIVVRTASDEAGDPSWIITFDKHIQGYLCIEDRELKFEC